MRCGYVDPECPCCTLCSSRTRVVPGAGPCDSNLVFVGEAPGKEEDLRGRPFVGMAGRLFDEALAKAGVERSKVRVTNLVKCRPPKNRRPYEKEISTCTSLYLNHELQEIAPNVVCALGQTVAKHFTGKTVKMEKAAGKTINVCISGRPTRLVIAYHPAACLYQRRHLKRFQSSIEAAVKAAADARS